MHSLSRSLILGIFFGCTTPTSAPQPLDGGWTLETEAGAGFAPRTMTLKQHGSAIGGTATATGVDRPIPLTVSGSYTDATPSGPPRIVLSFRLTDNGQPTAQFNGALQGTDRLAGPVIYYGVDFPPSDSLVFNRQTPNRL
jgi:hypothetical protein